MNFSCTVPGALTAYDLPDLAGCIAPRKLIIANLTDHMKESVPEYLIQEELAFPKLVYSDKNSRNNFKILSLQSGESFSEIVEWWLE